MDGDGAGNDGELGHLVETDGVEAEGEVEESMETPLRMAKRRSARRSTGLGSRRPARASDAKGEGDHEHVEGGEECDVAKAEGGHQVLVHDDDGDAGGDGEGQRPDGADPRVGGHSARDAAGGGRGREEGGWRGSDARPRKAERTATAVRRRRAEHMAERVVRAASALRPPGSQRAQRAHENFCHLCPNVAPRTRVRAACGPRSYVAKFPRSPRPSGDWSESRARVGEGRGSAPSALVVPALVQIRV